MILKACALTLNCLQQAMHAAPDTARALLNFPGGKDLLALRNQA